MPSPEELAAVARAIIDENRYMTLGTADEDGVPWVSPVWYAPSAYHEFFWVSSPDARHSRNVAARPEIGIVIFDSRAPAGSGQGVYMSAIAEEVAGAELAGGIGIFSRSPSFRAFLPGRARTCSRPRAIVYTARGHPSTSCSTPGTDASR
jgi:hypothetical protein